MSKPVQTCEPCMHAGNSRLAVGCYQMAMVPGERGKMPMCQMHLDQAAKWAGKIEQDWAYGKIR